MFCIDNLLFSNLCLIFAVLQLDIGTASEQVKRE
nr:MAG TPA: hypothetical protein [Caudoviricetes sp.]DAY82047.1 MAG TPA: hypothetical protein [Caudoviricetes sp.]